MTEVTEPILTDATGKQIVDQLNAIKCAIAGTTPTSKEWSITINQSSGSYALDAMGGDVTSWQIYRNKIGRYLVDHTTLVAKKLDKENSALLENGTTIDTTSADVMVRLPRLYYKVTTEGDLVTLTMCEREFGEGCDVIDEQWVGAYLGSLDSNGKLRSVPGVTTRRDRTISTFWADAQKTGTDYGLSDYNQWRLMMMIYLCEFLDKDSQACLGNGMAGTGNNWCSVVQNAKTGATAEIGDQCGKVLFTDAGQNVGGACHVSLFGIEDPYGWFWTMTQGMYFGNSANDDQDGTEAYAYEGNRMPTSDELATHPSGTYRQLTRVTSSGSLQTILAGPKFDVIPASVGSNRWGDYHWANTTGQLLLLGGYAPDGSRCGLAFSASTDVFSTSGSTFAARLAYHGNPSNIHISHD